MSSPISALLTGVVLVVAAVSMLSAQTAPTESRHSAEVLCVHEPKTAPATYAVEDLDGDGRAEFVFVSPTGLLEIRGLDANGALGPVRGAALQLPQPEHCLLACEDVLGGEERELVAATPRGVLAWRLVDGVYGGEPVRLTSRRRGKHRLRVGQPRFVPFVDDIDRDGHKDLVLPVGWQCELWRNPRGAGGEGPFEFVQALAVDTSIGRATRGRHLSSSLSNRITVDPFETEDVNGDGRPDLIVEGESSRAFYMQQADGRFATKPIEVDLSIFVDTTPEASMQLGKTLAGTDQQHMQSGDINADGIPDYVIAHRRRVWGFLGTKDGPQFTKADFRMRVAEDISGLMIVGLDDDGRSDLLLFKVIVPSAGELVLALMTSLDISITSIGYPATEAGKFATRPKWRRELTLRIPPVLSLMGRAEELNERVEGILSKVRRVVEGEFVAAGEKSLVMLGEDRTSLELWRGRGLPTSRREHLERRLRELLFEEADTVFTIERLLGLMEQAFDSRADAITGGRPPDGVELIDGAEQLVIVDTVARDLDGDGRDELILVARSTEVAGRKRFVVLRWS